MNPSPGYRTLSAVQALLYGLLVTSILIRPPVPIGDQSSVFERVATNIWWAVGFAVVAAALLLTSTLMPSQLTNGHAVMIPLLAGYGVANLGTSLLNGTGWQVGSLALALAVGHAHAIISREGPTS